MAVVYPISAVTKKDKEDGKMTIGKEGREMLKGIFGMTDQDIDKIGPDRAKLLASAPELFSYKITAEVVASKYCAAQLKVGDKLVFNANVLNKEESTAPPCIGALAPLMEPIHMMFDRLSEGLDPNGLWTRTVSCFDPGIERGGIGNVVFKLTAEKMG